MNRRLDKKIKKTFQECETFTQFESERLSYSDELRRYSLEYLSYIGLKVSPLYGEKTFWPEEIPNTTRSYYDLNSIIAGASTRGGDIFAVSRMTNRLNAVEVKSKDLKGKKKNLSHGKLSPKEVSLNKTKIKKTDRIVIHDFDDTSYLLDKDLDNWAPIHISQIFNEETYQACRDLVLHEKIEKFVPFGYRTDKLDGKFHEHQLNGIFKKILKQAVKWGKSIGLIIKPTATGKGVDPILLVKLFLAHYKWKAPIIITVSPSLNVLTGNVLKQIYDQSGGGNNLTPLVWSQVSDLTPSDDPKDLALLRALAETPNTENEFLKVIEEAKHGVWIHTTIHSYRKMEIALASIKAKIDVKFIDEVKHTVQEYDSSFFACLREKYVKTKHTIGLDANIVDGVEEGKNYKTSMRNTKLWREIYEEMTEEQAVKLGWKRKTKLITAPWQDKLLPTKLVEKLYENKNGLIRLKGTRCVIPFNWLVSICSIIEYRLKYKDRHHTMVTTNKIVFADRYEKAFKAILPLYLKQIKDPAKKAMVNRLKKLYIKSIYNFGKGSKKIQREVDSVPLNHKDSVIIQVRILGEGWDPKGAWLDSWSFADPTSSKIRIYQTGGRPARIGDNIFSPKIAESHCVVPVIIQTDVTKEIAINKAFRQLKTVANAMQIGSETIEDCVDFLPWQNINVPGGGIRTKGSVNRSVLIDMGIDEMKTAFIGQFKSGVRFSHWTPVVDEIFEETIKLYENKILTTQLKKKNTDKILRDPRYRNFFNLYSKDGQRRLPGDIRVGHLWMLSEENKVKGKTLWREYKDRYPNELKNNFNYIIDRLKATLYNIHFPHLHDRNIRYWAFIKDKDGKPLPKQKVGAMTSLMKGRNALYRYDKEYAKDLVKKTQDIIKDYESRLAKLRGEIVVEYVKQTKAYLNPTAPGTHGDINAAVTEKFKLPSRNKGGYGIVTIIAKRSAEVIKARKQSRKDNVELVKRLYRQRFARFVKANKGVELLDQEVVDVARKTHGVDVYGVGTIAEMRKKMPEFKKYKKAFFSIHIRSVCDKRAANGWTTWNKGKKTGPSRQRNKHGKLVIRKGKDLNLFPGQIKARQTWKKTIARNKKLFGTPWNPKSTKSRRKAG